MSLSTTLVRLNARLNFLFEKRMEKNTFVDLEKFTHTIKQQQQKMS